MKFCDELNNYLDLTNSSAKDLSESSGLSQSVISRYLNNERTPKIHSDYFFKIVDGIYSIACNQGLDLRKEDISKSLSNAIISQQVDFDNFVDNFNILQSKLDIANKDIAEFTGYDTSFISKIKSKNRKPSDIQAFIHRIVEYIVINYNSNANKDVIAFLLNCSIDDLEDQGSYNNRLFDWLTNSMEDNEKLIVNFLNSLDTFNLNDYIGTDFKKIKVPTTPVVLKTSKFFYGSEGRKQSEADFLKTTLLSKSKEPIYFYSNLPMAEAGKDEAFKKKWVLAMAMVLKKGLHLNIIHDVDRPISEMLLGLENWIPLYMTGSITPYYFEEQFYDLFNFSNMVSGSCALSGECVKNNLENSKFHLTTKKEEIEYYLDKAKYLMSKAKPLMVIYKEEDSNKFKIFMKEPENANLVKIEKDIFKNIDFYVKPGEYVIINKNVTPQIHFVVYNKKLINALEEFLID